MAPGGQAEVIEGIPASARSNIDQMIALLAAEQGGGGQNQGDEGKSNFDLEQCVYSLIVLILVLEFKDLCLCFHNRKSTE